MTSYIEYSFQMNKMKMTNIIDKANIIYSGKNFYKLQAEVAFITKKESSDEELTVQDDSTERNGKTETETEPGVTSGENGSSATGSHYYFTCSFR